MGDETPVLDAPTRVPAATQSSRSRPSRPGVAAPTLAGTLLGVQRSAGNRAAVAFANRIVQRAPDHRESRPRPVEERLERHDAMTAPLEP